MSTFLLTFVLFLLVFAALALGLMAGRGPVKGSCGGMSALTDGSCEICGGDPVKCDAEANAALNRRSDSSRVVQYEPRQH